MIYIYSLLGRAFLASGSMSRAPGEEFRKLGPEKAGAWCIGHNELPMDNRSGIHR